MSAVLALTQQLIRIPSITPEDKGCLDIIAARLKKLGFTIEFFPCQKANNLWARRGTTGPVFCFAGHTDVVATGPLEQWQSPPFEPTIRDGYLYGRGAADMKSGVAAFIIAIENFLQVHPNHHGSIALLITSAEEGPSELGTPVVIKALEARGEKINYCIVGEPSSQNQLGDTIKNGRRGSMHGKLTVHGKQGHIAYPHLATNPIHAASKAIAELIALEWDKGNEYFQPTQLQFYEIQAGTGAGNVIPGVLTCGFNFRFSPEVSAPQLQQRVQAVLTAQQLKYDISWELSGMPFLTKVGKLVNACQDVIEAQLGIKTTLSTSGGTSDGRFIAPTGAEVVELGVSNATIHQINECVALTELEQLVKLYDGILIKMCV